VGAVTTTVQPRTGLAPKRLYLITSIAEAVTWTLLIAGMVAKYVFDFDKLMFAFGLAHGTAFVAYAATALLVGLNQRWRTPHVVGAIAAAVVPYATIPVDRALERRGMLDGPWRTVETDDPRDTTVLDRALRWALRNPLLLAVVIVVAVVAIVTVLLQLGPPSEWGG
jgi:integral membrane protein